jgi:predicted phage tail protein
MISIKLKGELANLFIPEFDCEASGMFEAIAALKANFPRIIGYLRDSAARGIGFYIKVGYQTIAESDLNKVFSKKVKSLTITPIPIGSGGGAGGGGLMKIILGVALIGLSVHWCRVSRCQSTYTRVTWWRDAFKRRIQFFWKP